MLKATDLYKKYGSKEILCGVSLEVRSGECIGIAGRNGCGKTTLLSVLAGVTRPDRGSVCFHGMEALGNSRQFSQYAAYVPQENPLIPELTAYDNYRLWFSGDKKKMEESLSCGVGRRLGLHEFLKTPAGKLSGGQKKRLSIASALAGQSLASSAATAVLILDEPGAALDLEAKETIIEYIEEYTAMGGGVIITSHEMAELQISSKLYVLKDGQLLSAENGMTAAELIQRF